MNRKKTSSPLPLKYKTPSRWAKLALQDLHKLLSDHAYLERKAASNALDLLNRWPHPVHSDQWIEILSSIARDEALHLNLVLSVLKKKKGKLDRSHKSQYASDLRKLVRVGLGPVEVMDRLLVSALIEARSCERFRILSNNCRDEDLKKLYRSLWTSEYGHYTIFLRLAKSIRPKPEVEARWKILLTQEGKIIQNQPPGSGIHSGLLN